MSAFEKRVALVEKWHTDLTKSLDDMYDLAEQVLDVWQEAEKHTEQRIIKLLEDKQGFCHEISRGKKCDHEQCKWFPYIIELIKGETNE